MVAHRVGASIRQIADAAGLDRKTVANITAFENEKKDYLLIDSHGPKLPRAGFVRRHSTSASSTWC